MPDRSVPKTGLRGESYPPYEGTGRSHSERIRQSMGRNEQREVIARRLQGELFGKMVQDAEVFADIMNEHGAIPQHVLAMKAVSRRLHWLPKRYKDESENFWLIRDHGDTNYGGFPLFFGARNPSMEARQRIVIGQDGVIKVLTSLGESVTPYHKQIFHCKPATADCLIMRAALVLEPELTGPLYGQWLKDLVTVIYEQTGLQPKVPEQQPATENSLLALTQG